MTLSLQRKHVIVERKKDNTNDKYDEIHVSVKNTGAGIHPEIFSKNFYKIHY